jgi:hypothetical protein
VQKSNGSLSWYGTGGEVLMRTDLAGNSPSEYVFFGGKRLAVRVSSGNVYYYVGDHLSSSRAIVNSGGDICYDADYYPYGGERVSSWVLACGLTALRS